MKRHCKTCREVAATLESAIPLHLGGALDRATTHSPDYNDLFGVEPDIALPQHDICSGVISASLPARFAFTRAPELRGPSLLREPRTWKRPNFGCVEKMGALRPPMASTPREVRGLPERRIPATRSHKWHVAARLGPMARGDATN